MPPKSTFALYEAADDAWGAELHRLFGKRAGDMRYTKRGQGEPGSNLRVLYENRTMARAQWEKEAFGAKVSSFA